MRTSRAFFGGVLIVTAINLSACGDDGAAPPMDGSVDSSPVDAGPGDADARTDTGGPVDAAPDGPVDATVDAMDSAAPPPWRVELDAITVDLSAPVTEDDAVLDIAVDDSGVYVFYSGRIEKRSKLDGSMLWRVEGISTSGGDRLDRMALGPDGLYVTGVSTSGIDQSLVFQLLSLDTGDVIWERTANRARGTSRSCSPSCTNPSYFQERVTAVGATTDALYFGGNWESGFGFDLYGTIPNVADPMVDLQGRLGTNGRFVALDADATHIATVTSTQTRLETNTWGYVWNDGGTALDIALGADDVFTYENGSVRARARADGGERWRVSDSTLMPSPGFGNRIVADATDVYFSRVSDDGSESYLLRNQISDGLQVGNLTFDPTTSGDRIVAIAADDTDVYLAAELGTLDEVDIVVELSRVAKGF
jgi:hypothetical protein